MNIFLKIANLFSGTPKGVQEIWNKETLIKLNSPDYIDATAVSLKDAPKQFDVTGFNCGKMEINPITEDLAISKVDDKDVADRVVQSLSPQQERLANGLNIELMQITEDVAAINGRLSCFDPNDKIGIRQLLTTRGFQESAIKGVFAKEKSVLFPTITPRLDKVGPVKSLADIKRRIIVQQTIGTISALSGGGLTVISLFSGLSWPMDALSGAMTIGCLGLYLNSLIKGYSLSRFKHELMKTEQGKAEKK